MRSTAYFKKGVYKNMNYTTVERYVPSTDGIHTVYGKIYIPIGTPKATIQIIHGVCEHIDRYEEFMTFLAKNGFVAFGHDHLGHGKTAGGIGNLGFIAEENGDKLLVEDVHAFGNELINEYSNIPHILFGHSMGSFIARIYAENHPENVDLLIIAGTGGPQPLAPVGLAITDISGKLKGLEYRSEAAMKLFFTVCNQNFKDENSEHSWLSRDKEIIEEYESDDYCTFDFSVKAMNDLVMLSTECNSEEWFKNFRRDLPVLIISGELDPVGDNGKGVFEVYKKLEENGVEDISFKLYSGCRHELLNELNKDEVMEDILRWISNRIEK